jgi:hypothetical protein
MNIETVYSEIGVYLGEEVNIESKILIDIDGSIFLSDGMLDSNFKIVVEESNLRSKLEGEMTCTVGAPNLRYCNNARICGVLNENNGNYFIGELKSLELDIGDRGVVQII